MEQAGGEFVEQVIRPTGLVDQNREADRRPDRRPGARSGQAERDELVTATRSSRRPDRLPARTGASRPLPAPRSTRCAGWNCCASCGSAVRRAGRHQPAAEGWTCRVSWCQSWMPTKFLRLKGGSLVQTIGRAARTCRPNFYTPTASPSRYSGRSTNQPAPGEADRYNKRTASTPSRCAGRSPTSSTGLRGRGRRKVPVGGSGRTLPGKSQQGGCRRRSLRPRRQVDAASGAGRAHPAAEQQMVSNKGAAVETGRSCGTRCRFRRLRMDTMSIQ